MTYNLQLNQDKFEWSYINCLSRELMLLHYPVGTTTNKTPKFAAGKIMLNFEKRNMYCQLVLF